ncbi:MAG: diaminopimelate decarboxylase [Chitinophagales bacterium]
MTSNNHQPLLGGISPAQLTEQFGTPLYVYDAAIIERQCRKLSNAFQNVPLKIKFACKALNNIAILKFMRGLGVGLDAVSIEEVQLGLLAGFEPSQILFTPNSVSFDEIQEAVRLNVLVNIDNIAMLEHFGNAYGNTVPCAIRITPHIEAGGHHHIQTGHIDSKFGISIFQRRHLTRVIKTCNINVVGLHMHTGSDILDSQVFLQGAEILFDLAKEFPDLQFIDFGSGFKVAYKPDDVVTDIDDLGKTLGDRFNEFCFEYGRQLDLYLEPGKFLVSESGTLLVRANVIKPTISTVFVGVGSGQNHLIRPMFYDAYHHIINVSNPSGAQRIYTVVGYICETDTFGWDRKLNEVREGDILAILNAGAYGYTMSNNYNSRLRPAEVLIHDGKATLIRRREKLEDLLTTQIIGESVFSELS